MYSSLLEFPVRIGGQLGGGAPGTVRALREFGRRCGEVFLCAEDVLALRGERTRLDTTLAVMLEGRLSGVPDHCADPRLRSRTLEATIATGDAALRRARQAIAAIPEPAAVRILTEFAEPRCTTCCRACAACTVRA